jgi:hypothetical protein
MHFGSIYNVPEHVIEDLKKENPTKIEWPEKGEEFFEKKKPFELNAVEIEWLGHTIPLPFCDGGDVISMKGSKVALNFDWVTSSFMLLSGWQEHAQKSVGSRLSTKDTYQYRYKCIRKPLVNYYFDILKTALEKAWDIKIELKRTNTAVFLSHSFQHVNSGWKNNLKSELGTYNFGNIFYMMFRRIFGKDIWRTLDYILELEEEYDAKSTFFLMARKGKGYADYDITKEPYHSWIKDIQGRGFESALLSSNGCHNSAHKLGSDIKRYKYKVYANRFQSCRYKSVQSARALEKNKVLYDNSLAMYDEVGFRNAYCHPFVGWNFKEDRPNKFVSIPLNILDTAMMKRKYLSVVPKDVVNVFNFLANQSAMFNGIISMNWSNENFSEFANNEWRKVYERVLKSVIENRYNFKTGYQIYSDSIENGLKI